MVQPMATAGSTLDDDRSPDRPGPRTGVAHMHASITDVPLETKVDGIETRGVTWGDVTVRHVVLPAGVDFSPLFEGLPDDLCQCAHWGYVTEGAITVRYTDGTEETTRAGELFSWPGGHTGWTDEGVTFIEFSPAEAIRPVLEHLARQMSTTG